MLGLQKFKKKVNDLFTITESQEFLFALWSGINGRYSITRPVALIRNTPISIDQVIGREYSCRVNKLSPEGVEGSVLYIQPTTWNREATPEQVNKLSVKVFVANNPSHYNRNRVEMPQKDIRLAYFIEEFSEVNQMRMHIPDEYFRV
jgi:hypothetical protein